MRRIGEFLMLGLALVVGVWQLGVPPHVAEGAKQALFGSAEPVAGAKDPWSSNYVAPSTPLHFANCAEARGAGAAPIRRGEEGYRPALDRDRDGIACEPWR